MKHRRRSWLCAIGVAGAVLAPAAGLTLYLIAVVGVKPATLDDWFAIAAVFGISLVCSGAGVLGLGAPYLLWLRRIGRLRVAPILIGATVLGAVYLAALAWMVSWNNRPPQLQQFAVGAILGAISGLGYCAGARPNNSSKPTPLRGAA